MARIAESAPREAGPRVRLAIASRAATRRGSPDASQTVPWEQAERLAHEVSPSPRCHEPARYFVLGLTARRDEGRREMGRFVAGSSRSHQPAAWAGVGRAWEMLVRGGSSAGSLTSVEGSEPLPLSLCWSQCTDGEVRADEDQEPPRTDHRGAARADHRTHRGFRPCLADGDRSCPSAASTPVVRRWTDAVGRVRSPRCRACVPGGQAGWVAGRALVRAGACWGYDGSSLHDRGLRGREVRGDLA